MGHKKDIGSLFENKLKDGKIAPNQKIWERIDHSLNQEKYRRKRNVFYWVVGGGTLFFLGILFLINAENFVQLDSPEQNDTNIINLSNPSSEKESGKDILEISKEDSLALEKTGNSLSIDDSEENLNRIEIEDSSKTDSSIKEKNFSSKTKKNKPNEDSLDEIYTVTTKYYYYNSQDEKKIVTTDKNKIDSLISGKQHSLDSISLKKTDSTDSNIKP